MVAVPDGVEVVATASDADDLPAPPLLIIDRITGFLDDQGLGSGPIDWERIGDGQSNVTYRLRRTGCDVVLRRGPRPPLPKSTHDMLREARILGLLAPQGVPVPKVLATCPDESVLGVPFYVMEMLDGQVIMRELPPELDIPGAPSAITDGLIDTLAQLHTVEVSGDSPLAGLGRPEGYLARQVDRFSGLWSANTQRSLPEVAQLADWLRANLPTSQRASVVHGDYRLGNLLYQPNPPVGVQAVLDWEMATLGDPLADLGYLTVTYTDPGAPATLLELSPVTGQPGFPTAAELAERYAEQTGLDLSALAWYQVLALWKGAIFCEAIYTRWLRGERPDDHDFAPRLEAGIPQLLERGRQIAGVA